MSSSSLNLKTGAGKALFAAVLIAAAAALVMFAVWSFGHAIALNAAEAEVAKLGVQLAPSDPHARFAYAGLLERTLLPADQTLALAELERSVELSPHHYVYWLALGRAREQAGSSSEAEFAFRRAVELAPNYARARWALGNALLRSGRRDEGFAELRMAVASDAAFANPAAAAAWQIYGGDLAGVSQAIGDSPRVNAAVALILANEKRYADAVAAWQRIPAADKRNDLAEAGKTLHAKLAEAGRYRSAIAVALDAGLLVEGGVRTGAVTNPGFESSIAASEAGIFNWKISDGSYPRIGLNSDRRSGGQYSLLINFGQGGKGSRTVAQDIGVEPAARYELRFRYISDLRPDPKMRCDILLPAAEAIAGIQLMPAAEWTEARISFTVPDGAEGIQLRIRPELCSAESCNAGGNIWFDDFELIRL